MTQSLRVGLIGAGRIGRLHAQSLASRVAGAELAVICDASPEQARTVAEVVRADNWTSDTAAVLGDPRISAVVIASPTPTHVPLIIAAARSGKAIFCEKPISLDLDTTDEAIAAVRAAGAYLQIGFQRRYDAAYQRAKVLVESGALGRVEFVRDAMRDPAPPSAEYVAVSGGLYLDMTIHNFDAVRWLVGDEVVQVYALGATLIDPDIARLGDIDTSVVTLRFANGCLASIENSRRAAFGYDVRTEIHGSLGAAFVGAERQTPILELSREGSKADHVQGFLERFGDAYVAELRDFVSRVATGRQPTVGGADARAALALACAAEASRRQNRPVELAAYAPRRG